ncbi:MAG: enoyl-CoA hydratase/isomerase family protein [Thermodesulfobacteriota bacterium]|jgi:enoyl-CoA hydratase/carnithine racemase
MFINYEKEGRIATFTLNRPEVGNAVNLQMVIELRESMLDFRDDDGLWVGIVTGSGNAFCSGADIKDFLPVLQKSRLKPWTIPDTPIRGFNLYKPLIAAINGVAYGGGLELALGCDIRVASENARLGQLEVTVGMMPGWGGTQRLPRLIPWNMAAEMIFTGKPIDAHEAYRIGLINRVVPQDKLMDTAKEIATNICKVGPLAVRKAKEAMLKGINMTLEYGLELEDTLVGYVTSSEDFTEGIKAYKEKRKPIFKAK